MSHDKHKVCIKVPKVYDWVQRQVDLPLMSFDGGDMDDLFDNLNNNNDYDTEVCKFLQKHPGFQVHCNLVEDSIYTQEIKQHPKRQDIDVTLPNGDNVTLQKVKVLVKGLVEVTITDAHGKVLAVSDEIPFATAQTFFLCAPEGTDLHAKVTYFQCDSDIICTDDFEQLDISILICLDVQMEADVKLEVEAAICKPRQELPIEDVVCPTEKFPPQCPEIFPGKGKC
ncbi:hypothetical protein [Bacillus sp. FJAT-45350]|uniref:hypothetical protein n=1 Tax=Bacillus sp. FJAT-45350 TaxID=2011014 RepID=UPI000BB930D5|nr:hypothetical protein [Bacillus sp. FJAT-45350]